MVRLEETHAGYGNAVELVSTAEGAWKAPGARIIDRSGCKRLAIGRDGFLTAMETGTLVDKTMLIADVVDSGYAATLFCRPRRFGKTLNMTMMKAFFEAADAGGLSEGQARAVFEGTEVWDAGGGRYRRYRGMYPVVHISFNTVKKDCWKSSFAEFCALVSDEYLRHAYLREEGTSLPAEDLAYFDAIAGGSADDAAFARSLSSLCRMLRAYHGKNVVVLVDEYDAPVMAGYTYGYYDQVVGFLKGWLTGALKDGGAALAFACLTGVQRITKESIFSDLNNIYVSTPLTDDFDERYGFTDAEVQALAVYLGHSGCMPEAREWYDGYRFGNVDVYNPWSVTNYLNKGCAPGTYWGNTSDNSVLGDLVANADVDTLANVYSLLEPGGTVLARLDLGVVFPDIGIREDALWSMLYLAGYVTTDDTAFPNDEMARRALRVPNKEVRCLFRNEVLARFIGVAGGDARLDALHGALVQGDGEMLAHELAGIVERASFFDLVDERSCHMLLMGLLFDVRGYMDPVSNREAGFGRFDIRLEPDPQARSRDAVAPRPLITVEVKYLRPADAPDGADELDAALHAMAGEGLTQIADNAYDAVLPPVAQGRMRWGIAFSGKHVVAECERLEWMA